MKEYDLIIVGAGPAGLGAAIEFSQYDKSVLVIDENKLPGGQLFKQTHKFFGSREHNAGMRGNIIGTRLLEETRKNQIEVLLGTRVWGIFEDQTIAVVSDEINRRIKFKYLLLATGAVENAVSFPGCTLPGVISAGAAQSLMNVQLVQPGKKAVILGSGNVGLIVAYQLVQAGVKVQAVVDMSESISGYMVHAAKIKRLGIPFYLGCTVEEAKGEEVLERVKIKKVSNCSDSPQNIEIEADTLCIAVGLTPRLELAQLAGCRMTYSGLLGGKIPVHNHTMQTSSQNIFVAGDLSGVEEASTALDEGRMAGLYIAGNMGLLDEQILNSKSVEIEQRLSQLREGPFGDKRKNNKETIWASYKEENKFGA